MGSGSLEETMVALLKCYGQTLSECILIEHFPPWDLWGSGGPHSFIFSLQLLSQVIETPFPLLCLLTVSLGENGVSGLRWFAFDWLAIVREKVKGSRWQLCSLAWRGGSRCFRKLFSLGDLDCQVVRSACWL
jgi:hypothetical protein